MAITLVKSGGTDEYSIGTGLDPITLAATLDDTSSPATKDSDTEIAQIRCTTYKYEDVALSIQTETDTGVDYKLSLNGTNWFDALTSGSGGDAAGEIDDIDATSGTVTKTVYIKAVVSNTGNAVAGVNDNAKVRLTATEIQ
jgi:hypothetical protein